MMQQSSPAKSTDADNMQPPLNREPKKSLSDQDAETLDSETPALAPDTNASVFRSADAFRRLFESGAAADMLTSEEFTKFEEAFKSGDMVEIDKVIKSSDSSQKFFGSGMFQSANSLKTARSSSIGSQQQLLPGVFESKDWAPLFANSHVDVDPNKVFQSENTGAGAASLPTKPKGTMGTDWNALYLSKLPSFPPPPLPRTTRSSSAEQQQAKQAKPALAVSSSLNPPHVSAEPEQSKPKPTPLVQVLSTPNPIYSAAVPAPPSVSSTSRKRREPSVKIYHDPLPDDVLLGRGGRTNHHPGNKRYLALKQAIQPRYIAASKQDKTGISQELVDKVKSSGARFLELDPVNQKWFEITELKARKKASQTLRESNTAEERAAKRARYGK